MLSFHETLFKTAPDFNGAQLPDTLVLTAINLTDLKGNLDLRAFAIDSLRIRRGQDARCHIFLDGISPDNLTKLIVPYNLFRITFPDSVGEEGNRHVFPFEQKEPVYEIIIKKCRDVGMIESVAGWDIEYKKLKIRRNFENGWSWLGEIWILFQERWWNFGYAKGLILFVWMPVFFFIFTLINYLTIERQLRKLYFDPEIGRNYRDANVNTATKMISSFSRDWRKKLAYTLHYTGVVFFGFKVKHEALNFRSFGWIAYFYFMYIVGLLHLAFSLNFILSR